MWMPLPCYSSDSPTKLWPFRQLILESKVEPMKSEVFLLYYFFQLRGSFHETPRSVWRSLAFVNVCRRKKLCLVHSAHWVLSVIHGNEWWSVKQCPVSKSWTNMTFSRSQRNGPLSQRTPAIDSQHLAKYAPLLVKANSVYNSGPTAFLKSAALTPSPVTSKMNSSGLLIVLPIFSQIFI